MKPAYIYGLRDPRDGAVRYIGRTENLKHRENAHRSTVPQQYCRGRALQAWISELAAAGLRVDLVVLEECDAADAKEREGAWLSRYEHADPPLLNVRGPAVAAHWITRGVTAHMPPEEWEAFTALCRRHGWSNGRGFRHLLQRLLAENLAD